jgi:hypothetical protein
MQFSQNCEDSMDEFECDSVTKGDIFVEFMSAVDANQIEKVKTFVCDYPFVVSAFWTGHLNAPSELIVKSQSDTACARRNVLNVQEQVVTLSNTRRLCAYNEAMLVALGMPNQ